MTSRELARLILRRWYLVLVGLAATIAILWPATHRPGVYWTQVEVVVLPPTFDRFPNRYEDPQYSLSALAGVIVTDFNGGHVPLQTASSEATLYGEGVREGTQVRMLNLGTQWNPLYDLPRIDVQVVGDDSVVVAQQANQITAKLADLLAQRQRDLNVDPALAASMTTLPSEPSVYYITGSRTRAMAAGGIVGLVLTISAVYALEKFLIRRRTRRRGLSAAPPGTPLPSRRQRGSAVAGRRTRASGEAEPPRASLRNDSPVPANRAAALPSLVEPARRVGPAIGLMVDRGVHPPSGR